MSRFEFSDDVPPMAHYHREAVEQISLCVEERVFCALLGPRLCGKTLILHFIENRLSRLLGWNSIFLDLMTIRATTQREFFADLIRQTAEKLAAISETEIILPDDTDAGSAVFRGFLLDNIARLEGDLVLLIDPLEALPVDLVQALLTSLRAAYMDQQSSENHLIVVVSGALSLAELTVGESSPFRGIARRVFIGDLNDHQSRELIGAFLNEFGVLGTRQAVDQLLAATQGDVYLIRKLTENGANLVRERHEPRLRARDVNNLVRRFLRDEVAEYAPLQEAVRLIEENPDLIQCILFLLEQDLVERARLPLPLSPDLDPLYLTGVVEKIGLEHYRLQNSIYRDYLTLHFSPERIGHLLTLAGRWDMALDYLESRVERGSLRLRADLILATVNSIFASTDLSHAVSYLLRCLSAAFHIQEARVWHKPPRKNYLEMIGSTRSHNNHGMWAGQQIALSEDRLEARVYRLRTSLRGLELGNKISRALPLVKLGEPEPIGVITIEEPVRRDSSVSLRERELELMGFLSQASRALHAVIARRQELAFAGQLQASLLPSESPAIPGYELTANWLPARETSGDFYDFFSLPGGRFGIMIADVVDKGMEAALLMALGRTLVRTHITDHPDTPDALLRVVNRRLRTELENGTLITVIYGILDPAAGTFHYSNAGHPPARLFQKNRATAPILLPPSGVPLGMFDQVSWRSEKVTLQPGSLLVMYTDGIEDAQDEKGTLFGAERVVGSVQGAEMQAASGTRDTLLRDLSAFTGSTPRFDDITLVLLSRDLEEGPVRLHDQP